MYFSLTIKICLVTTLIWRQKNFTGYATIKAGSKGTSVSRIVFISFVTLNHVLYIQKQTKILCHIIFSILFQTEQDTSLKISQYTVQAQQANKYANKTQHIENIFYKLILIYKIYFFVKLHQKQSFVLHALWG